VAINSCPHQLSKFPPTIVTSQTAAKCIPEGKFLLQLKLDLPFLTLLHPTDIRYRIPLFL
jgi:hypothetical protein